MYTLELGGRLTEHRYLDSLVTAILLDIFERYPERGHLPPLERHGKSPGIILHNGHELTGCDQCIHELRQPFQPYGYDQ